MQNSPVMAASRLLEKRLKTPALVSWEISAEMSSSSLENPSGTFSLLIFLMLRMIFSAVGTFFWVSSSRGDSGASLKQKFDPK